MFLSPEVFRIYMLSFVFKELVPVTDRFHVRPLLPLLMSPGESGIEKNQIRLSASLQSTPQYIEVPPNTEAKRIISRFSAILSCQSNYSLSLMIPRFYFFKVVGKPFAVTTYVTPLNKGPKN
jgi:hypothetical protein